MVDRTILIETIARTEMKDAAHSEDVHSEVRSEVRSEDVISVAARNHARFVFGVVHAVLRNGADAEDAVQETFLRAMKHRSEFARVDDQRAWLALGFRPTMER